MSKDVPLLASEKIKLAILGIVLLSVLISLFSCVYDSITRDADGYKKDMANICSYYKIVDVVYSESINSYQLTIDADSWAVTDQEHRLDYVKKCYAAICDALHDNKIKDKDQDPSVNFLVKGEIVASVFFGLPIVY